MKTEQFEEKLKKAKELLEELNNPEITLEKSMKAYKEGIKTLNEASEILENAKLLYEELEQETQESTSS